MHHTLTACAPGAGDGAAQGGLRARGRQAPEGDPAAMNGGGEEIGVIGSPSSSSILLVDILEPAAEARLVGAYCVIKFRQGGSDAYALGQVTEVKMRNAFAEEPSMKGLIKQRGSVPPVSAEQDSHAADMMVSAVFETTGGGGTGAVHQATMDTVPHTGTPVRRMSQPALDRLMEPYAAGTVRVGRALGGNVLLPSWFRHFGPRAEGGAGDAMHIGIFGKTGSGKSVLAKMILLSYMRNREMSLLVLDPQGEFSALADDERTVRRVVGAGRGIRAYGLSQIALAEDWDVFKRMLAASGFFASLAIKAAANQGHAADQVQYILEGKFRPRAAPPGGISGDWSGGADAAGGADADGPAGGGAGGRIPLDSAHSREAFDRVWDALRLEERGRGKRAFRPVLTAIYSGTNEQNRVLAAMERADRDEMYQRWRSVASLFTTEGRDGAVRLDDLIGGIGGSGGGGVAVVNLSETSAPPDLFWSERAQTMAVRHILDRLVLAAKGSFAAGGDLNALVVLDEAHRFAPRERPEDEDEDALRLRGALRDAVRTTRKYGLGWMFISQTLASLDREILQQLRMYFFGYGLAWGRELDALRELVGGNKAAQRLYQQFQDPESSAGERKYPFMSVGPSSPLATSQIPQFFNSLQFPDEFASENAAAGEGKGDGAGEEDADRPANGAAGSGAGGGRDPPTSPLFA